MNVLRVLLLDPFRGHLPTPPLPKPSQMVLATRLPSTVEAVAHFLSPLTIRLNIGYLSPINIPHTPLMYVLMFFFLQRMIQSRS